MVIMLIYPLILDDCSTTENVRISFIYCTYVEHVFVSCGAEASHLNCKDDLIALGCMK